MKSSKISKTPFSERLEKLGFNTIVDEAIVANLLDEYASSPNAMRMGQYHFFENVEKMGDRNGVFYRTISAFKNTQTKCATIGKYNISSLLSGYSKYEKPNGEVVNAKAFFNINENNKQEKINDVLINRAIEVIEDYGKNSLKWRFIAKNIFTADDGLIGSNEFLDYWENKIYDRIMI